MVGEPFGFSLDKLVNFAEKENRLPLEETFAFRYIEDLETRLDLIINHETKGEWAAYWEGGSDERNIAGYIGDRLCDGIKRTWLPFAVQEDYFADFDYRTCKGPGYTGGMYFGVPAAAFEGQASIAEYFSRFLSVPAHKELEQAIIKVSKYRDLIRTAAKHIKVEKRAVGHFRSYIQAANQVLLQQKEQTKTKKILAEQGVIVNGSIAEQLFIKAQIWQPATIAPEFFQRIFLDTGVELTPTVLENPLILQELDRGRKIYWQSKSEN